LRARIRQYRYVRRLEKPLPPLPPLSEHNVMPKYSSVRSVNSALSLTPGEVQEEREHLRRKQKDRRERAKLKAAAEAVEQMARIEEKEAERERRQEEQVARAEEEQHRRDLVAALALSIFVPGIAGTAAGVLAAARPAAHALGSPTRANTARQRMLFLQVFMSHRIKNWRRRTAAQELYGVLHGWSVAGRLLVVTRKYYDHVVRIQRAWRDARAAAQERKDAACALWLRLERAALAAGVRAEDQAKLARDQKKKRSKPEKPVSRETLTVAERVELRLLPEVKREAIVTNALNARKRALIPRLEQYERDMRAWKRNLAEWRETKAALRTVAGHGAAERDIPPLPGLPPSLALDASEVGQLIARARAPKPESPVRPSVVALPAESRSPSPRRTPRPGAARRSPKRSPRRPRRRFFVQDVQEIFRESNRQVTEELYASYDGSPSALSDRPPAEEDLQKMQLFG